MPNFAANLTMLYNEVDFLDRFAAAARDGFAGVEFLFPYAYPKDELAARLKEHKLAQALHNLPAGDWAGGERGIACHPDRVEEFRAGVAKGIEYATALGCKQLNCLAGKAPEGVPEAELRRTFVEQSALRRTGAGQGRHQAAGRAGQQPRHPGLLSEQVGAGDLDHGRGRLGQSLPAVRLLPYADHGRRSDDDLPAAAEPDRATSRSRTIRAATSPARARSTIRSSSGCWTPRAMPAGSAASTSPRPRPRPASAGSPLTPKAPPEPRHRRSSTHESRFHRSGHHGAAHGRSTSRTAATSSICSRAAAWPRRCSTRAASPAARPRRWPSRPR